MTIVATTVAELPQQRDAGQPLPAIRPEQVEPHESALYTDARGGFWAGVTSAVCVGIVAVGNLMLLAAALGQESTIRLFPGVFVWVLSAGLTVGLVVMMILHGKHVRAGKYRHADGHSRIDWSAVFWGVAAGMGVGFVVAVLFGIARLSAAGTPLAWQPIVGLSLSVIAIAAFGGFYLASRRARIGLAASFVLTFLVLLSYMLTLDGLAAVTDGSVASGFMRELLEDFRGSVALIVGFYFGTDAAVSVVKILRTRADGGELGRLDRDLAVPAAQGATER